MREQWIRLQAEFHKLIGRLPIGDKAVAKFMGIVDPVSGKGWCDCSATGFESYTSDKLSILADEAGRLLPASAWGGKLGRLPIPAPRERLQLTAAGGQWVMFVADTDSNRTDWQAVPNAENGDISFTGRVDRFAEASELAIDRILGQLTTWDDSPPGTTHDKKDDTQKKQKKNPRLFTVECGDCVGRYTAALGSDPNITMESVVDDYAAEKSGRSAKGIMRRLNDHPDTWKRLKANAKTTRKRQSRAGTK